MNFDALAGVLPREFLDSLSNAVSNPAKDSKIVSVKYHNELSELVLVKGGTPFKGQTIVITDDSGNLVIERTDGSSWESTTAIGGGWVVGSCVGIVDPTDNSIINVGIIDSFESNGSKMILDSDSLDEEEITEGSFLYNIHPVWSISGFAEHEYPLEEGDLVLDVKTGSGTGTGIFTVDKLGWTEYKPSIDPGVCRLVWCEYPGDNGTYLFTLVSMNSEGSKTWQQIYVAGDALKLQGVRVSSSTPSDGDVLTFNNSSNKWEPAEPEGGGVTVGSYVIRDCTAGTITLEENKIHFANKAGAEVQIFNIPSSADDWADGSWVEVWGRVSPDGWKVVQPANDTDSIVVWAAGDDVTSSGDAGSVESGDQFDAIRIVKFTNRKFHMIMLRGTPTVV